MLKIYIFLLLPGKCYFVPSCYTSSQLERCSPVGPVEIFWLLLTPLHFFGHEIIFHQPRFPWNFRGPISLPKSYLLGGPIGRVFGRELIWHAKLRRHWRWWAKMLRLESFSPITSRHGARSTSPCRPWDPCRWPGKEAFLANQVGWDGFGEEKVMLSPF